MGPSQLGPIYPSSHISKESIILAVSIYQKSQGMLHRIPSVRPSLVSARFDKNVVKLSVPNMRGKFGFQCCQNAKMLQLRRERNSLLFL